ncbi:MAG: SRPBCC domain-containing protein [Pseudomonadota bacterium]
MTSLDLRPLPVRHSVDVRLPPSEAFDLFTREIGVWWPKGDRRPGTTLEMERRRGGRLTERRADGTRFEWGRIAAWEPNRRFVLTWTREAEEDHEELPIAVTFARTSTGTCVTVSYELAASALPRASAAVMQTWRGALAAAHRHAMQTVAVCV